MRSVMHGVCSTAVSERIQEEGRQIAQRMIEAARLREASISQRTAAAQAEAESKANDVFQAAVARAEALVAEAEAKAENTCAAADKLAASIRKKAEDERDAMVGNGYVLVYSLIDELIDWLMD